jgi:hypothetical protein
LQTAKLSLDFSSPKNGSSEKEKRAVRSRGGLTWLPFCLFIREQSDFDDEATRLIGEAFHAACKGLRDTGQPALVREIIAKRIIEAAKKGERDPARLRAAGLAALGYEREVI